MLQERSREFAVAETLNGGKTIRESRDTDIPFASAHFFSRGWAGKLDLFRRSKAKLLGVCGQVIPWNFPLLMAAWKIAPALATGNTVILRPRRPRRSPRSSSRNCFKIPAPPASSTSSPADTPRRHRAAYPDIDKIAFTGSTAVGKWIQKELAGSQKKYTLELGGKAANIIFADAAIDQAVEGIINAIHGTEIPPLTLTTCPVMWLAEGLARKATIGATSSAVGTPSRARFSAF